MHVVTLPSTAPVRTRLQNALVGRGHHPVVCRDGASLRAVCRRRPPEMVLLEIGLSDSIGTTETIRAVVDRSRSVLVAVVSDPSAEVMKRVAALEPDVVIEATEDDALLNAHLEIAERRVDGLRQVREVAGRYRALFEAAPIGVALVAPDGRIVEANGTMARLVGFEREELCALDFVTITHPADRGRSLDLYRAFQRGDRDSYQYEKRYLHRHDRDVWIRLTVSLVPELVAEGRYCFSMAEDITRQREALEGLRIHSGRLTEILENANDAFFALDDRWRITYVNRQAERLVRRDRDLLIGTRLWEGIPELTISVADALERALHRRERVESEMYFQALGTWLRVQAWPYGSGTAAFVQDVTPLRELEHAILAISSREQRRVGQDLHDVLGAHLTGVAMLCRTLARRAEKGSSVGKAELDEVADLVQDAITQARTLAHGLDPLHLLSDGLPLVLRELAVNTQSRSGIHCEFVGEVLRHELSDEVAMHLYRIAQEAVGNAMRHAEAENITIRLASSEGRTVLEIRDDGKGLPEDRSRTVGMGLRLMQYRANVIGATFSASGAPGQGTIVTCTLLRSEAGTPVVTNKAVGHP
jgi:PAS domain S-box-containing protein